MVDKNDKPRVGDEVRLYSVNGERNGWDTVAGEPGKVAKVGRTLVTIESPRLHRGAEQFRLDTQRANDRYGHEYYRTLQEAEEYRRYSVAEAELARHRIHVEPGAELTVEQIEALAAVFDGQ